MADRYLGIEHVEGEPIDAYCDANRLTTRERLSLFLSVAQAVHHAHRNLVVHRDLKPANILVTRDAQVKVLDFGIAKLLSPQAMELTVPETGAGYRWLTPAFAAPERDQIVTALGQARLEAEKSDAVAEFLIGLFEAGNPGEGWGEDVTGGELLERGERRTEALDAQPEVQVRLLDVIGRTYQRLAAFSKAQPLFDRSLAIRRELYGEEHLEVAKGLQEVGENHRHRGELDAAETLLTEAMQMRRRLLGEEDEELADGLFELGQIAWRRGDHDRAERLLRQALAIQRELLGSDHAATITTLSRLGLRLWQKVTPRCTRYGTGQNDPRPMIHSRVPMRTGPRAVSLGPHPSSSRRALSPKRLL